MLRRALNAPFLRRRKNINIKIARRWLQDRDRYAISKTKEPPLHPWFNKQRAYELLKETERLRNMHPLTIKYNEDSREKFRKHAVEYSMYKTHRMIRDTHDITVQLASEKEAMEHVSTLPEYLQIELKRDHSKYDLPHSLEFLKMYNPQIAKFNPPDMKKNWILGERLHDIGNDRIPYHEE